MPEPTSVVLAGIFVGGQSTRMEGRPKGLLLSSSGETLVERWRNMFAALAIDVVLVGRHDAYAGIELEQLADDPPGIGPLGGLIALLSRAGEGDVIAVACDMPFVSLALLEKLAVFGPGAAAVAARSEDRWEPLFARYSARDALACCRERAARRKHSLQGLLDELSAKALPLRKDELSQLRDWDTPADLTAQ